MRSTYYLGWGFLLFAAIAATIGISNFSGLAWIAEPLTGIFLVLAAVFSVLGLTGLRLPRRLR